MSTSGRSFGGSFLERSPSVTPLGAFGGSGTEQRAVYSSQGNAKKGLKCHHLGQETPPATVGRPSSGCNYSIVQPHVRAIVHYAGAAHQFEDSAKGCTMNFGAVHTQTNRP